MSIQIPAFQLIQNKIPMLVFVTTVKMIYERFDVSQRVDDKKLGYQRSFSKTRIKEIKNYINQEQGIIPNSILVNIDEGKFDYQENDNLLILEDTNSLGLIIDGQHRVNGCYDANPDFPLMVIATLGLSVKDQAKLFVIINKTQKGVPTSLYLDLMNLLEGEIEDFDGEGVTAERRAREIAIRLNETDESPLYELIRTTGEAGFGISLNEFVTQIRDYVEPKTGKLASLGFEQQYKVFEIYFRSVKAVFLEEWNDPKSYILKTVGFGGLMAAFYEVFNLVMQKYQMFNTENTIKLLLSIQDFKFDKDNLPGGAGFKAQEKVGDMIVSKLKNAVREDFAVMIGD